MLGGSYSWMYCAISRLLPNGRLSSAKPFGVIATAARLPKNSPSSRRASARSRRRSSSSPTTRTPCSTGLRNHMPCRHAQAPVSGISHHRGLRSSPVRSTASTVTASRMKLTSCGRAERLALAAMTPSVATRAAGTERRTPAANAERHYREDHQAESEEPGDARQAEPVLELRCDDLGPPVAGSPVLVAEVGHRARMADRSSVEELLTHHQVPPGVRIGQRGRRLRGQRAEGAEDGKDEAADAQRAQESHDPGVVAQLGET